jgi:hypothetical protein
MSDDVNQTNVSDNAAVNIGTSGSAFVPIQGKTIAIPSDVPPTAVTTRPHRLKQRIHVRSTVSKLREFQPFQRSNNRTNFLQT